MSPETDRVGDVLKFNFSYPFSELEKRLRRATLKDRNIPDFSPYLHADISLEKVRIDDLYPCALYVLKENLNRAGEIRKALRGRGIDIFNLTENKSLVNYDWGDRRGIEMGPPVVEVSGDDGGILVITDGLHRVTEARMEEEKEMVVVKVDNVSIPLPVLPVSWNEVKVVDSVPQIKRKFRFSSYEEIKKWTAENYSRFIQGFDFPELDWQKGIYPEHSKSPWREGLTERDRAATIVSSDDKVLMVQRADSGLWGLPSGCVEIYDQPYRVSGMSARRELVEETGLVALEWRLINHIFKEGSRVGWIYEAKVIDGTHVDMNLEDYISVFNESRGNMEVSKLGLFSLKGVGDLEKNGKLFKPEYNLIAVENYIRRKTDGSLEKVPDCYAPWDAPDIFWHRQESFPFFAPMRINNPEDLMPQIKF